MSASEQHPPCRCDSPTDACPRYGWMRGRRHDICQGRHVTAAARDRLLSLWSGGLLAGDVSVPGPLAAGDVSAPGPLGVIRPAAERPPCVHLGAATGEVRACGSCNRALSRHAVYACARHGACTLTRSFADVACCAVCGDHREAT